MHHWLTGSFVHRLTDTLPLYWLDCYYWIPVSGLFDSGILLSGFPIVALVLQFCHALPFCLCFLLENDKSNSIGLDITLIVDVFLGDRWFSTQPFLPRLKRLTKPFVPFQRLPKLVDAEGKTNEEIRSLDRMRIDNGKQLCTIKTGTSQFIFWKLWSKSWKIVNTNNYTEIREKFKFCLKSNNCSKLLSKTTKSRKKKTEQLFFSIEVASKTLQPNFQSVPESQSTTWANFLLPRKLLIASLKFKKTIFTIWIFSFHIKINFTITQ